MMMIMMYICEFEYIYIYMGGYLEAVVVQWLSLFTMVKV